MILILGGALIVCLFIEISRMAAISANSKYISDLYADIGELEADRQYLDVALSASKDLQRVYDEAVGRLGMSYPGDGQVKLISLAQYDVTGSAQAAREAAEGDLADNAR